MRILSKITLLSALVFAMPLNLTARAQRIDFESLPGVRPIGNTLIRNESIEAVVRGMIARSLNGDMSGSRLEVSTEAYQQTVELPHPSPELKEILDVLGVQNHLNVSINPVRATFQLPASTLKVSVTKKGGNRFEVIAGWKITELSAKTNRLSLKIPKGFFDRDFNIDSTPITLGLKRGSRPIDLEIKLLLDLTDEGTRIQITGYRTNLKDRAPPQFYLSLGKLTVEGEPLELEFQSNGQSLIAKESTIRQQFQEMTPEIIQTLKDQLVTAIHDNVLSIAKKIEEQPPLKLTLISDDLFRDSNISSSFKDFLSSIQTDLMFNHLQYLDSSRLFSAQLAARFCIDGACLMTSSTPSPIGETDLYSMASQDNVGIVFYESTFQDLVHSEAIQSRIRKLYKAAGASPGVDLSPAGIKVRFDPKNNAVSAILNLQIDIAKTIRSNSSFGERMSLELGDLIETLFGSGSSVKIPLEIKIKIDTIAPAPNGGMQLTVHSILPFTASGTYLPPVNCPQGWCQSNVSSMTSFVRESFMKSVHAEFKKILPEKLVIPVNKDMAVRDFSFSPKTVKITPNRGLLISGLLRDEEGNAK